MNCLQSVTTKIKNCFDTTVQSSGGNIFHFLFILLIVILPFHVLLSVFMEHKIGIGGFALYKEIILFLMAGILLFHVVTKKIKITLDWLDWAFVGYVSWMILITLFYPQPLAHLVYGGRYDFEFLFAFYLVKHGISLLPYRPMKYLSFLVYSGGIALLLGILVRWVFGEDILLHFGFSGNLSNWNFGGSIPIYHGIDGANVRRFQGIFDGPNPAGFFILFYFGVLATYYRSAKDYYYLLSLGAGVLLVTLFYTYSRSAVLGLIGGLGIFLLANVGVIWKKHKSILLWMIPIIAVLAGGFYFKFEGTIHQIILREGSTKGHFDRAVIGINRFIQKPLGSGLASAGPAYRFVQQPDENISLFQGENKIREDYYIPESWFIQQLVEGGIIGFILFVVMLAGIAWKLLKQNTFLLASFSAMAIMNLFLHTYESVYVSLLLFMIVALVLYSHKSQTHATK